MSEERLPGGGYFRVHEEGQIVLHGPQGEWLYSSPIHRWRNAIEALAPQPQGDRAALVERLKTSARALRSEIADMPDGGRMAAKAAHAALHEAARLLSAPAEATGHTDLMVTPESVPDYSPIAHFGASLREARVRAGLSLRDAAALFGVTAERYGAVERGVAEATERPAQGEAELRERIASVLHDHNESAYDPDARTPFEWADDCDRADMLEIADKVLRALGRPPQGSAPQDAGE